MFDQDRHVPASSIEFARVLRGVFVRNPKDPTAPPLFVPMTFIGEAVARDRAARGLPVDTEALRDQSADWSPPASKRQLSSSV